MRQKLNGLATWREAKRLNRPCGDGFWLNLLKILVVNNSFVLSLVGSEKMTTFALELRAEVKKMSVYSLGIPFKIACSGEAARQFYNPLGESVFNGKRAIIDGITTASMARILLMI